MNKRYLDTVIKNNSQKDGIAYAWQNQHPTMKWWLVLSSVCYVLGTVFLIMNV